MIKMYKSSASISEVSVDKSYDNPVIWAVTQKGGILEQRLFLRMGELNEYATDGRVYAVDSAVPDETSWVQFAPEQNGGPGTYSSQFEFSILPLGGEIVFWVKMEIPQALEQGNKTDISLAVSYIRHET
jgi:hypothetical protein